LQPGDRVLEVGCGWGGFAEQAALQGIHVHGVTISPSQLAIARQRLQALGLQQRAQVELCDYRDLQGSYDAIVSIEMFEAVGEQYWPEYFRTLQARLKPGGQALVQSITIAEQHFDRYRSSTDFIQEYIFPGGMLPSIERFEQGARRAGLQPQGHHAFGRDYAETLRRWDQQCRATRPRIMEQASMKASCASGICTLPIAKPPSTKAVPTWCNSTCAKTERNTQYELSTQRPHH
jgi:cyclopropane-fatty-acyl-phospholipid synthase